MNKIIIVIDDALSIRDCDIIALYETSIDSDVKEGFLEDLGITVCNKTRYFINRTSTDSEQFVIIRIM